VQLLAVSLSLRLLSTAETEKLEFAAQGTFETGTESQP